MSIGSIARAVKERLYPRRPIGFGAVGQVYQQRRPLGRKIAIKVPHSKTTQRGRASIMTEALILRDLQHPNILRYLDHAGDFSSLQTEFVEGVTLRQYFFGKGRLRPREVLLIFKEVVSAVAYIHDRGYVHADLKWTNVIKTKKGIKLIDFDIARPEGIRLDAEIRNPDQAKIVGSIAYLTPTRIKEQRPPVKSDDIFALGLMLFEMLTGERAIKIQRTITWENLEEQLTEAHQLLQRRIDDLDLPNEIKFLIKQMIGLNGHTQFNNCYEILAAIDSILAEEERA